MTITQTFIIYFTVYIITAYAVNLAYMNNHNNKLIILHLFAVSFPVLLASLRFSIGTDYFSYVNGFNLISQGFDTRWTNVEFGFVLMNKCLSWIGLGPQSIFFAASLITMLFLFAALKDKNNVMSAGLGSFVYMLIFYQSSFNVVRLMIAVSIFLYNISNIINRKIVKYILFTILAMSFHISALITLPFYVLYGMLKTENHPLRRLFIYIISGAFMVFFNPILEWILKLFNYSIISYYQNYIGNSGESTRVAIMKLLMHLPMIIPGLFLYSKCKLNDKSFQVYYSLLIIGVMFNFFGTFNLTYVDRISDYFLISSVVVIPSYIRVLKKHNAIIYYSSSIGILSYVIAYWVYSYFILKLHGTVPYQWILQ